MREPFALMSHQRPVERLEPLLASFAASDLTHLELRDGEFAVELVRRNPKRAAQQPSAAVQPVASVQAVPAAPVAVPASNERIVRAELVGVVRLIKPVLVEGMLLERDREVATIESLGVKTPIRGGTGRVTRVLVDDGDAVDYGQALFVVEHV